MERDLLAALHALDQEVADAARAGRKPEVVSRVMRLRELSGGLPPGADPLLRHCLERQSWEKARLLLEGRRSEVRHGEAGCA